MSFLTSFFALDAESFLNTPAWAFIVICKSPKLNGATTVFLTPNSLRVHGTCDTFGILRLLL